MDTLSLQSALDARGLPNFEPNPGHASLHLVDARAPAFAQGRSIPNLYPITVGRCPRHDLDSLSHPRIARADLIEKPRVQSMKG